MSKCMSCKNLCLEDIEYCNLDNSCDKNYGKYKPLGFSVEDILEKEVLEWYCDRYGMECENVPRNICSYNFADCDCTKPSYWETRVNMYEYNKRLKKVWCKNVSG